MYTDPIADLIIRIKNASKAHHQALSINYSKLKENILQVMKEKGFIENYEIKEEKNYKILEITLREDKKGIEVKRISKPGQRIYIKSKELKNIKSGLGFQILSTPKGVMSNFEAKKQNLGGELLCEIS